MGEGGGGKGVGDGERNNVGRHSGMRRDGAGRNLWCHKRTREMDSGFDAEPVIGPRFARTRWHRPGMTAAPHALFLANAAFSRSRRAESAATLRTEAEFTARKLDFRALGSMFAQPLGSLSGNMRNIITKSLIVVVPRRAAGDG
jgi:hypothetical protein